MLPHLQQFNSELNKHLDQAKVTNNRINLAFSIITCIASRFLKNKDQKSLR